MHSSLNARGQTKHVKKNTLPEEQRKLYEEYTITSILGTRMNPIDLPAKEWINEELATLQCERNKGLGEVPFKRELYLGKRVAGIQQLLLIEAALSGCCAQPRVGVCEENEGRARQIEIERERVCVCEAQAWQTCEERPDGALQF